MRTRRRRERTKSACKAGLSTQFLAPNDSTPVESLGKPDSLPNDSLNLSPVESLDSDFSTPPNHLPVESLGEESPTIRLCPVSGGENAKAWVESEFSPTIRFLFSRKRAEAKAWVESDVSNDSTEIFDRRKSALPVESLGGERLGRESSLKII